MDSIIFEGKKVTYFQNGEITNPVLVLLHGFCEDSSLWEEFIEDLVTDFYIIRVDLSGFGQSDMLPNNSIDLMAASVKAVLDHLEVSHCVMMGHSMGGYVTLSYAEMWGDTLAGVGMFHSHPFADTDARKESRRKSIEFINRHGHALYVKQLIPSLFAQLFVSSNEFLMNRLIHNATQYSSDAIIGALQAMIARPDRAHVLANAPYPVSFIIGKQDITIPFDVSMRQTILPNIADVQILPKVAHMGMYRAKDETVRIVRNFMQYCQQPVVQ